jgi:uncharacterized BrkB/YihY/UPF0761 family membrane protein
MQARLFLILIFISLLMVLLTNDATSLFNPIDITLFEKKIQLNSEIVVALTMLSTLIIVLVVGLLNRIFFYPDSKKERDEKT